MALADLTTEATAVRIFQESLRRDRLAHAYLLAGGTAESAESLALQIAKTLNCESPATDPTTQRAIDACDQCLSCRQIERRQQADVTWIRPESKSRIITIAQIRSVLDTIHLKAHGASYKVIVIVGAERMNPQAANAFLKTLEEPPAKSVMLLLSTDTQRLLDTILSRCRRINLESTRSLEADPEGLAWLGSLSNRILSQPKGASTRYHILAELLDLLNAKKAGIDETLSAASPLQTHDDLEPKLRDRYKQELAASIEAEYRRQRAELIALFQWFLRDIWLQTMRAGESLLLFPSLKTHTEQIADRISTQAALNNVELTDKLQRQLNTNVQEALAIEVTFLRIAL